MLKPGRIGGQGGGAAEVLGIRMLDHTAFDVTALHGRVLDAVFCLVHCFHDATRTGDGTRGLTRQSRLAPIQLAGRRVVSATKSGRGPSANVTFPVRVPPDLVCQVTEMTSPG